MLLYSHTKLALNSPVSHWSGVILFEKDTKVIETPLSGKLKKFTFSLLYVDCFLYLNKPCLSRLHGGLEQSSKSLSDSLENAVTNSLGINTDRQRASPEKC